jgi:hypothetical protein
MRDSAHRLSILNEYFRMQLSLIKPVYCNAVQSDVTNLVLVTCNVILVHSSCSRNSVFQEE